MSKKSTALRPVVKTDKLENNSVRYVNGNPVSARFSWLYRLTLDCGHVITRSRPNGKATCPKGCTLAKGVE